MLKIVFPCALVIALATPARADQIINVTLPLTIKSVGAYSSAQIACKASALDAADAKSDLATAFAQGTNSKLLSVPLTNGSSTTSALAFPYSVGSSPKMKSLICEVQGFMATPGSALVPIAQISLNMSEKNAATTSVQEIPNY